MEDLVVNSPAGGFAMRGSHEVRNTLVVILVTVVVLTVVALLQKILWHPLKMRRIMIKQGVAAAPFHILMGSLPECFAYAAKFSGDLHIDDHYDSTPTVSPMNIPYFPKNEKFFVYEWGSEPRLASRDPEFAKEVLLTRGNDFGKAKLNSFILELVIGNESVAVIQDVPRHDKHRYILTLFLYTQALMAMHLDATLWGEDVFKFNPKRFANGVSKACTHPQAFLPFSSGPNFCIGNNFATMELKIVLATVLQRFQIHVSPSYKHHPHLHLVQRPRYGLPLVLKAL